MYKCCDNCEHSECTNIENLYFKCKLRGCSVEPSQEPCRDYKPESARGERQFEVIVLSGAYCE